MKYPAFFRRILARRQGGAVLFGLLFLAVSFVTRLILLVQSRATVNFDASLLAAFGWGLAYDFGAALLYAIPVHLLLVALPARFFAAKWGRVAAVVAVFAALAGLWFGAVAEVLFWDEFSVRFNFIAVDYLVYTKEVIGNIEESYPMPLIFGGIAFAALTSTWIFWR